MNVRQNERTVSVAVIVAVGVNSDGRREVLGMEIGPSEADASGLPFCASWLAVGCAASSWSSRTPTKASEEVVSKLFCATWQRCRVHCMCNALAHAGKSGAVRPYVR